MTFAPPRPASTVVLIRPSASRFEVFLVRRHDNIAFMGGAHVFPGGRVDEADRSWGEALEFHVAAARELFEEAGILLARHPGAAAPIHMSDARDIERYRRHRTSLAKGEISLREVIDREGLELALDGMALFAHWVTPQVEIKRFDTRFFVAAAPDGQVPAHDERETTEGDWIDPDAALERCRRDEIALPPPTWTTLRALAKMSSVDEVMRWARARRIVTIQPNIIRTERLTMLTLPGDPTFPAVEGVETFEETRFILTKGRWRAEPPPLR